MLDCVTVEYKDQYYMVCRFKYKDISQLFVLDYEDYSTIMEVRENWHKINNYVGCFMTNDDGVRFVQYVHNVVMGVVPTGKGSKWTVDHINRHGYDNRKANLRLVTQTVQNENQNKRDRTIKLPEGCGVEPHEIPRSMWYQADRERFVIEIKQNGKVIIKEPCIGNKDYRIRLKFEMAKKRLIEICKENPKLVKNKHLLENYSDNAIKLMKEYNDIILASGYKCAKKCLITIPDKSVLEINYDKLIDAEIKILNQPKCGNMKKGNRLPPNCGVTPDMIPKHCRYLPEDDKRGDGFIVERHPDLPPGKRSIGTTRDRSVTTLKKHEELLKTLNKLKEMKNSQGSSPVPTQKEVPSKKKTALVKKEVPSKKRPAIVKQYHLRKKPAPKSNSVSKKKSLSCKKKYCGSKTSRTKK